MRTKPHKMPTHGGKKPTELFGPPLFKVKDATKEVLYVQQVGTEFYFHAKCFGGKLDITIVTRELRDGLPVPKGRKSSPPLKAHALFPMMFEHFARKKNPVTQLSGLLAWQNYHDFDAIKKRLARAQPSVGDEELSKKALQEMIGTGTGTPRYWVDHNGVTFDDVLFVRDRPKAGDVGLLRFIVGQSGKSGVQ